MVSTAQRPPSAPTPRYNPASVYGAPINRRSRDVVASPVKKSSDGVRKSGGGGVKRPGSAGGGGGAYNAVSILRIGPVTGVKIRFSFLNTLNLNSVRLL